VVQPRKRLERNVSPNTASGWLESLHRGQIIQGSTLNPKIGYLSHILSRGGAGGGGVFLRVFQIIIRRRPTIPRYIKPHSWAGVVRIWLAHIQTFKYYGEILTQNTRKIYMLHISPSFCQAKLTYVKPVTKISVTTQ
jgi:hypothetical protein